MFRGVLASVTAMYGFVYGRNKNGKIVGLESKKPPESGYAEYGGMTIVNQAIYILRLESAACMHIYRNCNWLGLRSRCQWPLQPMDQPVGVVWRRAEDGHERSVANSPKQSLKGLLNSETCRIA